MKLELKHLTPYLPYKPMVRFLYDDDSGGDWMPLNPDRGIDLFIHTMAFYKMKERQIAFHPLSDLTKRIEHNKVEFVPCDTLFDDYSDMDSSMTSKQGADAFIKNEGRLDLCFPLMFWDKLFEWHFDLFGLIDKGLAIDYNKINNKI